MWSDELKASQSMLKQWHKEADKIVGKYTGHHSKDIAAGGVNNNDFKLNLFHSNVTTLESMLYGNTPKIDVSRRYADPNDDTARVAAEMLERMLNLDVAANGEEIECVFKSVLQDRLVAGSGCARIRYDVQTMGEGAEEEMVSEDAPADYYFWGDVLWSWCRNWSEMRWLAYRNYLTKDEVRERWGDDAADNIPLKKQKMAGADEQESNPDLDDAWMKAEIWEVWDRESRTVSFMAFGYDKILSSVEDPLGLSGFFPSPPFLIANPTTSLYIPTPDYTLAQDLYNEIDTLQTRIAIITEAVKVVGLYDSAQDASIGRMLKEGNENELIPVDNWALFAEKGGIDGVVGWFPIGEIVNVLDKLTQSRNDAIGLLQQVTGMSDVMQGGLNNQYEGVGQSEIKTKFGSTRIQRLQEQFAKFASDLMQLKAEIISLHFSPQTIAQRSAMSTSVDREMIPDAIKLIKNPKEAMLRVTIRPESIAMVDFAELKAERTEYINALSTFMQSAAPLIEADPAAKPFLLQLLQWGLAGFKGASEIEGVIDKAIEESQKAEKEKQAKGPEPDPAVQMEQAKQQGELKKIQTKAMADGQLRQQDLEADVQTAQAAHDMKMAEIIAGMQAKLAEIKAKFEADVVLEQVQAESNMQQTAATVEGEIQKDIVEAELDQNKSVVSTQLKIAEISANAAAKIEEAKAKPKPTTTTPAAKK